MLGTLKGYDCQIMKKNGFKYILPPAVTLVIYSIILAVKGIYPFGGNTIDYYDMAQQIAAFYYHVYDALHGMKGFFYDWYTALGVNMAMSTSGCSNLSPFNLFFLFIRRESLLQSLSVFNGFKLMCMSLSMYFYLDKTHEKAPYFFKLAASAGYSFCGFVLVLYITNQWIDIAVMFPLIMYFYDRLIETGKIRGYVITLAITLIASYYLGFMILIFIFLYTGLKLIEGYIFSTGSKKYFDDLHLTQLGIGTFLSLALSSFIIVPQLTQMLSSARFKNGNEAGGGLPGGYLEIISHVRGDYTTRWWTLLGLSFASAVIFTGIIKLRKDHRAVFMSVTMILMMVLELFFESINRIWHFGSYVQYPIRNGFIIYFVFAYWMCYFAGQIYGGEIRENDESGQDGTDNSIKGQYLSFVFTVIGFLAFIAFYRNNPGMPLRRVFHITSAIMAVTFVYYLLVLNWGSFKHPIRFVRRKNLEEDGYIEDTRRNGVRYGWAAGVIVCEVLCFGFLLFGKPEFITGYGEEPEQDGEYIYICDQLREAFDLEPGFLYRMKNPDETLNANYGLVLMQPELSNWTHMIAPGEQAGAAQWGYSIQFTRLLDSGGTAFSDALLGVRNVISCVPMDERLYETVDKASIIVDHLTGEKVVYTLYKPKYTLPFGIMITDGNNEDGDRADVEETDIVKLHNMIYHSMQTGSQRDDEREGGDINSSAKTEDNIEQDPTNYAAYWLVHKEMPSDTNTAAGPAEVTVRSTGSSKEVYIKAEIRDEAALYLLGSGGDREYANCTIEVAKDADISSSDFGWRYIPVPTIKDAENIYYPAHFNNNAVYLGTFRDETVNLRVIMDLDKGEPFDVDVMGLSLDATERVCAAYADVPDDYIKAGKNTLEFTMTVPGGNEGKKSGIAEKSMMALLPLTYDKGWDVKINGRKTDACSYAGLFTAIPLREGENRVYMKFTPSGMLIGSIVTLVSLALCAVYVIICRVRKTDMLMILSGRLSPVLNRIYACATAAVVLFMYIIPVIYGVFVLFAYE